MTNQPLDWLSAQTRKARSLVLIIDRMAEPDPIAQLFNADLMQDYINLYQGTEVTDLTDLGPWLVSLPDSHAPVVRSLLEERERNWGWLASVEQIDLHTLAVHWRERMLIDEGNGQRSLYRFQDNRVIARHLTALSPKQLPMLLGPIASALAWDGQTWQSFDNPAPGFYPASQESPWLHLAEPDDVTEAIHKHNLRLWLWQNHATDLDSVIETQTLDTWLDERLAQAKTWQWHTLENLHFLLARHLDQKLAGNAAWLPRSSESAQAHFARCLQTFNTPSSAIPA